MDLSVFITIIILSSSFIYSWFGSKSFSAFIVKLSIILFVYYFMPTIVRAFIYLDFSKLALYINRSYIYCSGFGLHNIIVYIALITGLYELFISIKNRNKANLFMPLIVIFICCYVSISIQANVKLATIQYGYSIEALTTPSENITYKEEDSIINANFNTGEFDEFGNNVMPPIKVYTFGPFNYSVVDLTDLPNLH